MRTTIRFDDTLLRRAKAEAAASGRSLNDFIEDAVRVAVAPRVARRKGVELPTFKGRGLQPGVDLDDSSDLLDLMEGAESSLYRNVRGNRRARRKGAETPGKT